MHRHSTQFWCNTKCRTSTTLLPTRAILGYFGGGVWLTFFRSCFDINADRLPLWVPIIGHHVKLSALTGSGEVNGAFSAAGCPTAVHATSHRPPHQRSCRVP